jgi:hypothetical protein
MRLLKVFERRFRALLILMGIAAIFTPGIFRCSADVSKNGNSGQISIVVNR